jgi:phosphatidylinositol N-acetylglucosaminyltransferase subunit A
MSRLDFKKGTDLLVEIIPKICRKYPNAYFIIGGDGPKMPILRFMVQKCGIEKRVELLGRVPHE